jgi:hypothetical protein
MRQQENYWIELDNYRDASIGSKLTNLAALQRSITNFVNIVTGKTIPVEFKSRGGSYTDGQTVVIGSSIDSKSFNSTIGLALHEGSHIAYTDFSLFKGVNGSSMQGTDMARRVRMRGLDPDLNMTNEQFGIIKNLLNWVEDRRIDYNVYKSAPGYRVYYEAMYDKYFNDKEIDKALKNGLKTSESWDDYMFHIINFTNPLRNLSALEKLQDIWNIIDLQNINRLKTTVDALDVAIDIYKVLNDHIQATTKEEPGQTTQSSNNGNVAEDDTGKIESEEGVSSDDDFGCSDTPANNQDDTDKKLERTLERLEKAIDKQKDFMDGNVKKRGSLTNKEKEVINIIKTSGTESKTVEIKDPNGFIEITETTIIRRLSMDVINNMPNVFSTNKYDVEKMDQSVRHGIVLGKRLGSKLQLRNKITDLKQTRLKSGKIDTRLIHEAGFSAENLFHKVVTDSFKNYFIHISIDASGSMWGDKLRNAIISAVAIAQAASMTTGIRVQISFRGTINYNDCLTIYAYDSATDKMSKVKQLFKYIYTFGGTPEGISFKSILSNLKKDAKGDECIFINYSDGEPTSVNGIKRSNPVDVTKDAVKEIEKSGFNVISYFIESSEAWGLDKMRKIFKYMYGADAMFIDPVNMTQVSKTMNEKFLELNK